MTAPPDDSDAPVVELRDVTRRFDLADSLLDRLLGTRTSLEALVDVSLAVAAGETLGVVGESGCGKTTLAHLVAGRYAPTSGEIRIDGTPVGPARTRPSDLLTDVGLVFQNPRASLDPRLPVRSVIAEPLTSQGWAADRREARVREVLAQVELSPAHLERYPHELSGGEAQRVAIARAIAPSPRVLILDEPVSALDVSVQAKILNLLVDLQADLELTCLFISHDLSVVRHVADRIAVMYLGRVMEVAPTDQLFDRPTNPYTEALLSAIPSVDPTTPADDRIVLAGDVPSPVDPPTGCPFRTRCPYAEPVCTDDPPMERVGEALSRCHLAGTFDADE